MYNSKRTSKLQCFSVIFKKKMLFWIGKYSLMIEDSHFFNKCSVGVGEDVSLLSSQRAARDVEVDPQVGVVSFYRHTDVLDRERQAKSETSVNIKKKQNKRTIGE